VCTKEACQFNDNLAGFRAAGVPVIGVSPDNAASHQRFRGSTASSSSCSPTPATPSWAPGRLG
jgi:alkyl hydroperoxide reductase subunit AhpC